AVLDLYLDEAAQPFFRRTDLAELLEQKPESRNAQVDYGLANLVFGLEVVVNIAQRDPGLSGNVGQRSVAKPMSIGGLLRGMKQSCVGFRFGHLFVSIVR